MKAAKEDSMHDSWKTSFIILPVLATSGLLETGKFMLHINTVGRTKVRLQAEIKYWHAAVQFITEDKHQIIKMQKPKWF